MTPTALGDPNQLAKSIIDIATGQADEWVPSFQKAKSGAKVHRCGKAAEIGKPDADHISTSYVERQNLTTRIHMRRFTRLTNAFSKKLENHAAAIALHTMYYNFVRIYQTLRVTP